MGCGCAHAEQERGLWIVGVCHAPRAPVATKAEAAAVRTFSDTHSAMYLASQMMPWTCPIRQVCRKGVRRRVWCCAGEWEG